MEMMEAREIAGAVRSLANAITPLTTLPGHDATGGHVESLTEAVVGITSGLVQIADAISDLAAAIREGTAQI